MDINETENLISEMLNSQKPDKSVLSSAKSIMVKNKTILQRIKKQFYALTGCAAVFIIIGAIFTVLNQHITAPEGNSLNSVAEKSVAGFDNGLFIAAVALIIIGVAFAVAAVIMRIIKTHKNK